MDVAIANAYATDRHFAHIGVWLSDLGKCVCQNLFVDGIGANSRLE